MKTYAYLYNIAEFFLEWEVFQTKILSKVRHILCIKYFFPKIMLFILDHVQNMVVRSVRFPPSPKAVGPHSCPFWVYLVVWVSPPAFVPILIHPSNVMFLNQSVSPLCDAWLYFDPRTFQPVASRYADWATGPTANLNSVWSVTKRVLGELSYLFLSCIMYKTSNGKWQTYCEMRDCCLCHDYCVLCCWVV